MHAPPARPDWIPFGEYVHRAAAAGRLVVQPRMGFADPAEMRRGLLRTKQAAATTAGTITLDSYTRTGNHAAARAAWRAGLPLNGYPITTHDPQTTRSLLDDVRDGDFPVQVRHGTADPRSVIDAMVKVHLDATEGGPISYCLPYSRTPLAEAVRYWAHACERLARLRDQGLVPHLETFGGCMLGQLCPPGMLVAISVLEGMFFAEHGIGSISLSYAQQTNPAQDEEAVAALRALAEELLPVSDWHIVVYTYMGVYPRTPSGAGRLQAEATRLAVRGGAARLIVKTSAEAHRIPTIEENVRALEHAAVVAARTARPDRRVLAPDSAVLTEARRLVTAVLEISPLLTRAIPGAFARGILDIPYCLHPDNAGLTRSGIDPSGRLRWLATGRLPIPPAKAPRSAQMSAADLALALSYVQRKFDEEASDM